MRILEPNLNATIEMLGGSELEKSMLVGFLENQVASITGQINGLRANADNATRQADELEPHLAALTAMLEKFTDEVQETPTE